MTARLPIILHMAPVKRRPPVDPEEPVKPTPRPTTPRDIFDEWWPIVARVGGLGFAFVHVMVAQLGPGEIDPAVLTFCGTLVLLSAGGKKGDTP